jgi:hypothetical protein
MAYKYIANQPLDCILGGIPMTFKQGDIIPSQYVDYLIKNHKYAILECDENGIVGPQTQAPITPSVPAPVVEAPVVTETPTVPEAVKVEEPAVPPVKASDLPYKTMADLWALYKHDLVELCGKLGLEATGSKGALVARINAVLRLPEK